MKVSKMLNMKNIQINLTKNIKKKKANANKKSKMPKILRNR